MRYGAKSTVEKTFRIDIRQLKTAGFLGDYCSGTISGERGNGNVWFAVSTDEEFMDGKYIWFRYFARDNESGQMRNYDYKIPLSTTHCHFGGVRYWFRCYANLRHACGKRVATLFIAPGSEIFACRHCHNLSYNSKNKNRRYAFYPFVERGRLERERKKIIFKKGFRPQYAGEPTKIWWRLMRINRKIEAYIRMPISYPAWLINK